MVEGNKKLWTDRKVINKTYTRHNLIKRLTLFLNVSHAVYQIHDLFLYIYLFLYLYHVCHDGDL